MATKFSSTLFGVILTVGGINVASSAPMRLSNTQMDSVTAGTITITALANASASGNAVATQALTNVTIIQRGNVEIGRGVAIASASGSTNATASAFTSGTADGQKVIIRQINHNYSTATSQYAYSSIIIISINSPSLGLGSIHSHNFGAINSFSHDTGHQKY